MGEICYHHLKKSTCSSDHSKVTKSFHRKQLSFQNLFNLSTKQRILINVCMLVKKLSIFFKTFDEVSNSPSFVSGKLGKKPVTFRLLESRRKSLQLVYT